jgi:hypothetical protein
MKVIKKGGGIRPFEALATSRSMRKGATFYPLQNRSKETIESIAMVIREG